MTDDKDKATALVTGGGGFLGSAIVRRLLARGLRVRSLARRRYAELDALGVEQIEGDIAEGETVERACKGVELVFHTAAKFGVWGPYDDYFRTNVTGTRNVVQACRRYGVQRLIYTSSPSAIFDGRDMEGVDASVPYPRRFHAAYPATKAQAERYVLEFARERPRCIVLRPHLIWGPQDNHVVPRVIAQAHRLARIGRRPNRIDTIYIDNAADAHLLASDALAANAALSGKVYFISQDEPRPLWDVVNAILAAADLPPVTRTVPVWLAVAAASVLEMVHKLFRLPGEPRLTRFMVKELATAHWFDISAARRDLGYRPTVTYAEGLRRLRVWLQSEQREGR